MNGNTGSIKGSHSSREQPATRHRHWFSLPEPVRRVFDAFPLITNSENHLPQRASRTRSPHILYIFTPRRSTARSNLSCNPACLRWQAYLIINDIEFSVRSSNNHASPSGSLPFLLPRRTTTSAQPAPISSSKIQRWTISQTAKSDVAGDGMDIYQALMDQNIRNAWLYYLYLCPSNFAAVATPLYINSASSNPLVRMVIAAQLRTAAQDELLKTRQIIDKEEIFEAADKAFRSLSTILGSRKFFSDRTTPDLFDASLFAYTHLILDELLPWKDLTMQNILVRYPSLITHRERILKICMQS